MQREVANNLRKAIVRAFVVRYRLVRKMLRYIGSLMSLVPSIVFKTVPAANKELSHVCNTHANYKSAYADLWSLRKICINLRAVCRETGVSRLSDVLIVEDVLCLHEYVIPENTPWSHTEAKFLSESIVVRRWDVSASTDDTASEMSTIPPCTMELRHNVGKDWKDATGVITCFRGIRIAWASHITVYGYFRDVPISVLNAVFPQSRARVHHIQRMLRKRSDLTDYIVAATCRDLGPRDILVLTDTDILRRAKSFQAVNVDLRTFATRVSEKQRPVDVMTQLYVMGIVPVSNIARVQGRILYECICSQNVTIEPSVATTIKQGLPLYVRPVICSRMIGLTSPRAGRTPRSGITPPRFSHRGDQSPPQIHTIPNTPIRVPLDVRVSKRFKDDHPQVYAAASDRLREFREYKNGTDSHGKACQWLEALLNMPIGKYRVHPVVKLRKDLFGNRPTAEIASIIQHHEYSLLKTCNKTKGFTPPTDAWIHHWDKERKYRSMRKIQTQTLKNAEVTMDMTVYGCRTAKRVVHQLVAQWIGNHAGGAVIGLKGEPGVGKTTFIREGLARCFGDENDPHPFEFISLGGASNSSSLVGWKYTWHTSTYGRIAASLMRHKCMNPILYFDELDKVSRTNEGREIISILTHLTDSSQNSLFEDRYFADVPLDLSRCIIVFSYNDASAIDSILLDRLQQIHIPGLTIQGKCEVARRFLVPGLCKEVGVPSSMHSIPDEIVRHLVQRYTREAGVRRLKELLATVIRERNRLWLCHEFMPVLETNENAERLLLNLRPERIDRVGSRDESYIGAINALHAGGTYGGGITPVQVVRLSPRQFKRRRSLSGDNSSPKASYSAQLPSWSCVAPRILITGRQGKTMAEAAHVAATVASVLAKTADDVYFHLHCPDGATSKDGPSAGCAFTLAFLSVLQRRPIRQHLALTGEIDLLGRVRPVGGIAAKLAGAILHGVEIIILPYDNRHDAEVYMKENPLPPGIELHFVKTAADAADLALLPP